MKEIKIKGEFYDVKNGRKQYGYMWNITHTIKLRTNMILMGKEISYVDAEKEVKAAFKNEKTDKASIVGFETAIGDNFVLTMVKYGSRKYEVMKNLGYEEFYKG